MPDPHQQQIAEALDLVQQWYDDCRRKIEGFADDTSALAAAEVPRQTVLRVFARTQQIRSAAAQLEVAYRDYMKALFTQPPTMFDDCRRDG